MKLKLRHWYFSALVLMGIAALLLIHLIHLLAQVVVPRAVVLVPDALPAEKVCLIGGYPSR